MGAQPAEFLPPQEALEEGEAAPDGADAAAPNGVPDEEAAAPPMPPAADADVDMEVDDGGSPERYTCRSGSSLVSMLGLRMSSRRRGCRGQAMMRERQGFGGSEPGIARFTLPRTPATGEKKRHRCGAGGAAAARPPADAGELADAFAAAPLGRDAKPVDDREHGSRKQSAESDEDGQRREKSSKSRDRDRDRGRDAKEWEPVRDREKDRSRRDSDR